MAGKPKGFFYLDQRTVDCRSGMMANKALVYERTWMASAVSRASYLARNDRSHRLSPVQERSGDLQHLPV
jgi:hypothetical protein